jgi:hypothetical protein
MVEYKRSRGVGRLYHWGGAARQTVAPPRAIAGSSFLFGSFPLGLLPISAVFTLASPAAQATKQQKSNLYTSCMSGADSMGTVFSTPRMIGGACEDWQGTARYDRRFASQLSQAPSPGYTPNVS